MSTHKEGSKMLWLLTQAFVPQMFSYLHDCDLVQLGQGSRFTRQKIFGFLGKQKVWRKVSVDALCSGYWKYVLLEECSLPNLWTHRLDLPSKVESLIVRVRNFGIDGKNMHIFQENIRRILNRACELIWENFGFTMFWLLIIFFSPWKESTSYHIKRMLGGEYKSPCFLFPNITRLRIITTNRNVPTDGWERFSFRTCFPNLQRLHFVIVQSECDVAKGDLSISASLDPIRVTCEVVSNNKYLPIDFP